MPVSVVQAFWTVEPSPCSRGDGTQGHCLCLNAARLPQVPSGLRQDRSGVGAWQEAGCPGWQLSTELALKAQGGESGPAAPAVLRVRGPPHAQQSPPLIPGYTSIRWPRSTHPVTAAQTMGWGPYLLYACPGAAVTKHHKSGGLTEVYSLTLWRPEVQHQGVGSAVLPLKALGEGPPRLLQLLGQLSGWPSRARSRSPSMSASAVTRPSPLGVRVQISLFL